MATKMVDSDSVGSYVMKKRSLLDWKHLQQAY